jgi:uncharacterized membrane protein YdjX (TVP38/TMEM64 family)
LETTGFGEEFSLDSIQKKAAFLKSLVNDHYLLGVLVFISIYIIVNIWFPAAAVITLLGGFLFGTILGTIYVDVAAVSGALLAFWISRNLMGNWIQRRFSGQLKGFNRELSKYGYIYLILVRMIPMMPYFLINFMAGLTKIKTWTFIWTTAIGSLPGILVYSYAGRQLLSIKSVKDVLTFKVIIAFVLLAFFTGSIVIVRKIKNKNLKDVAE